MVPRELSIGDGLLAAGHCPPDSWSSLLAMRTKSSMSVTVRDGKPETRRYSRTTVSTLPLLTKYDPHVSIITSLSCACRTSSMAVVVVVVVLSLLLLRRVIPDGP